MGGDLGRENESGLFYLFWGRAFFRSLERGENNCGIIIHYI